MTTDWCILKFETGRHTAIPNSLGRLGVPCIVPMVSEIKNVPGRHTPVTVYRPALYNQLFMAADEQKIRLVLDSIRYAESVWRSSGGALRVVPDAEVQRFCDLLEAREKKPKAIKKAINLADMADKDAFDLFHRLFGISEAIKRVGKDLSDKQAA